MKVTNCVVLYEELRYCTQYGDLPSAVRLRVRIPVGERDFFPRSSRLALGPTQNPVHWVLGLLPGSKATGTWR